MATRAGTIDMEREGITASWSEADRKVTVYALVSTVRGARIGGADISPSWELVNRSGRRVSPRDWGKIGAAIVAAL